ncbi:MAG: hypothetical protein KAI66_27750, partial [Lentisphaeria bacterium]|nr:hypothetical protein [Lentisphaeria bacterium]
DHVGETMRTRTCACLLLLMPVTASVVAGKECSRLVSAQMRANALANAKKYEWAEAQQRRAVKAAKRWITMTDEELWRMVPSQGVPRNCGVHQTAGCPNCGDEFFKIKQGLAFRAPSPQFLEPALPVRPEPVGHGVAAQ